VRAIRNLAAGIALAIASLALALGLGELVVRQIFPVDTGTSFAFRIPHPILGWILKPGTTYTNRMPEGLSLVSYNSEGWRDVEHTLEKPPGTFRILVLGDSFMEAYSVDFAESLPGQLAQLASREGRQVEVINLGVGGFGTLQEYLAFHHFGRAYAPDLVLLAFYTENDVSNNSLALERVRAVDDAGQRVESRPFLDPDAADWRITPVDYAGALARYEAAQAARGGWLRRQLRENSALLRLVWLQLKRVAALAGGPQQDDAGAATRSELGVLGVYRCQEPEVYTHAWQITERILARLASEVEAAGARLLVFTVPAYRQVDEQDREQTLRAASEPESLCLEQGVAEARLAGLLDDLGIPLIDLLPTFRADAQRDGVKLHRASDRHWNAAGHALAAQTVFAFLRDAGWLPAPRSDLAP
jgi:hypothetical protein